MRKTCIVLALAITILGFNTIISCNGKPRLEKMVSKPDTKYSHKFGVDCMTCHNTKATPGLLTVAGSVLDEARELVQKNCVVKLYLVPGGKGRVVATLYSDALGNFYSCDSIDFSLGIYPTLLGTPGAKESKKHMSTPIFSGNCNGCHGISAEKLGID